MLLLARVAACMHACVCVVVSLACVVVTCACIIVSFACACVPASTHVATGVVVLCFTCAFCSVYPGSC